MVHIAIHNDRIDDFAEHESVDPEFLLDICRAYSRLTKKNPKQRVGHAFRVDSEDKVEEDKCYFHQHNDDFPRCK